MRLTTHRRFTTALTVLAISGSITSIVSGQSNKPICPDLDAKASAADQALCWFEADRRGSIECKKEDNGVSSCISQAVSYCADALLDAAPVANACFLAHLRAGQPDEALEFARYLQNPPEETQRCRKALKSVYVRIVSNPPGAEITVDEKHYGRAPTRARLTGNWWTKKILAVFGTGESVTTIEVQQDKLFDVFNRRACVMEDLVIEGPKTSPTDKEEVEPGIFEGRLWTWVALGGAVAFGGAGIFFGLQGDAAYEDLMNQCPDGCTEREIEEKIDNSGVETKELLTNIAFGLSGACLVGAGILYFVEGDSAVDSKQPAIAIGPAKVYLTGSF